MTGPGSQDIGAHLPDPGERHTTVDLHSDVLIDVLERRRYHGEGRVLVERHLHDLRSGGVKIQIAAIYVSSRHQPEGTLRQALLMIQALYDEVASDPDALRLVTTVDDLDRVLASDSHGLILGLEGAEPFGRDPELVGIFHALGVRVVGLTWNRANLFAQGAVEDTGGGLSGLGLDLVERLGARRMAVDVSHLNQPSFWDVIGRATGPVLASHSNARTVHDHARNLADDQLTALAQAGGIIGLNFQPAFIAESPQDALQALVVHASHIAELVGVRHLALGPDFTDYLDYLEPIEPAVQRPGVESADMPRPTVRDLPAFARALRSGGFHEDEVEAIMSGNALEFLRRLL